MSQKSTASQQSHLTILRVSVGSAYPMLWSSELTPEKLNQQNILTMIKVQENTDSRPVHSVNPLRSAALKEIETSWVWMVDCDVIITQASLNKVMELINGSKLSDYGLIGGLYETGARQTFIEKSYNRLCNLWSKSRKIPLAGNMLISKKILTDGFSLADIPLGQEEYHLTDWCIKKGLKVDVLDFPLPHLNKKDISSFIARCFSQVTFKPNKESIPWRNYFSELKSSFQKAPGQTLMVTLYLALHFISSISVQVPKSLREDLNKRGRRSERSLQSPHPLQDLD